MNNNAKELHAINGGEEQKNEELIERVPIEGSPFIIIKKEGKWFLTMGKYALSEPMNTQIDVQDWIVSNMWNIVTNIAAIMAELVYDKQS